MSGQEQAKLGKMKQTKSTTVTLSAAGDLCEELSSRMAKVSEEGVKKDVENTEMKEKDEVTGSSSKKMSRFKSFLLLTAHLNPFNHSYNHNHNHNHSQPQQQHNNHIQQSSKCEQQILDKKTRKASLDSFLTDRQVRVAEVSEEATINLGQDQASSNIKNRGHFAFLELAQRYLWRLPSSSNSSNRAKIDACKSAPVTPVKWPHLLDGTTSSINSKLPNGLCNQQDDLNDSDKLSNSKPVSLTTTNLDSDDKLLNGNKKHIVPTTYTVGNNLMMAQHRPSVRFVDNSGNNDDEDYEDDKFYEDGSDFYMSSEHNRIGGRSNRFEGRFWSPKSPNQHANFASPSKTPHFSEQAVQTSEDLIDNSRTLNAPPSSSSSHKTAYLDDKEINIVEKLFKLPAPGEDEPPLELQNGETPMNSDRFRQYGYNLIDYISNYLDTIDKRRVTPLNIEPGYLKSLIQPDAPEKGESFVKIMHDFENHIMCGITHWQHPHFHAYFPAGNAYPSILADMLSDALGCVGFSWAASPAYTELEIIMLDWMGKMIGLPEDFLCLSGGRNSSTGEESKGGGVIQGSASECVLVNLLAARHWAIDKLRKKYPNTADGILLSKLIGYCSKEAHSCVEKAAMIGFIRMRALDTDDKHSLRGETLFKAIQQDILNGFEPFIVCATLGTTSCVSFDNLEELGKVCQDYDIWLHVDAAYAGSALICPEFKYLIKGIELASSFNMNPNKWMLINFDCSLMWVKDRFKLTRAFVVDPLYLQHSFSDQAIDYRHWGIPLSRRFRALKLWFVIRNYGVKGLQDYIRNHVKLAKLFEKLILQDSRFTITNQVVLGLVCFRLVGSNALNQRLLSMINASGKLHMVPASLNGRYVIRFCVCDQNAQEKDIIYAYDCISQFATELFESIKSGKERIRAISQQNTIDVSSISLHTQQSASADRLNNMPAGGGTGSAASSCSSGNNPAQQVIAAADINSTQSASNQQQQQQQQPPVSPREAARNYMMQRNIKHSATLHSDDHHHHRANPSTTPLSSCPSPSQQSNTPTNTTNNQQSFSAKSLLTKQVSVQQQQINDGIQQLQQTLGAEEEDLEQEIVLDSLATIDGYDYDLDDEDLLEAPYFDDVHEQQKIEGVSGLNTSSNQASDGASAAATGATAPGNVKNAADSTLSTSTLDDCRSPVARRWHSRASRSPRNQYTLAGGEHEEAEDEVLTLAERRNRMSLRYKREFFVRVVSDPRVYRASISGDINAHASCASLGGPIHQTTSAVPASTINITATATSTSTTTTAPITTTNQQQTRAFGNCSKNTQSTTTRATTSITNRSGERNP